MDLEQSSSLVFDFVDRLLDDVERGEVRPLHEYLPRYPGCEEEISKEYFALLKVPDEQPSPTELRVGPYRLVRQLGRGGQGVVWLAEDSRFVRQVALKMLAAPLGTIPERQRERLRREAEVVSRLDHPDICSVYEADLSGEVPYVSMRFVPGDTLASVIAASVTDNSASSKREPGATTAPDIQQTTRTFERIARALHAAHEAGVVHRDVKPGNIMITPEGAPVLLDFGLARTLLEHGADEQTALTASGEVFGTLAYMAPEQHGTDPEAARDRRVDVYALGVTLYETLTGKCPFHAPSSRGLLEAVLRGEALAPRRLNPNIPRDLEAVCLTAMAPESGRRYATAAAFAEDLQAVLDGRPVTARPRSASTLLMRRASRHPWTTGATAALVLISLISVILAQGWQDEVVAREQRHEQQTAAHAAFLRLRDAHREDRTPDPVDEAVVQRFIPTDATLERQVILGSPLSRDAADLFVRYAADATRGTAGGLQARYPTGVVAEPVPQFTLAGEAAELDRRLSILLEQPGSGMAAMTHEVTWPAGRLSMSWQLPIAPPLAPGYWRWSVREAEAMAEAAPLVSAVFQVVDLEAPQQLLADLPTLGNRSLDAELRVVHLLHAGFGQAALDELAKLQQLEAGAPQSPASDEATDLSSDDRARRLLLSAWASGLLGRTETVNALRAEWLELRRSARP